MRTILRNTLIFCSLVLMGMGFSACSKDETPDPVVPEMAAVAEATSWDTAKVTVSTKSISEWAWMVLPANEQVPSETIIFKDGTAVEGADGEITININGLDRLTEYSFYAAAKYVDEYQQEKFFEDVVVAEFTTLDYSEEVTITKVKVDGMDVHIKVPEQVKAGTSVLKWGVQNIVMYNTQKHGWMGTTADARMLCLNDEMYPKAILTDDTTLNIDEDHRYVTDENGDIVVDDWGDAAYYWDFIAPGEPLILLISEFGWGESDWGWGEGWYLMPFDEMGFMGDYETAMWEGGEFPNEEDYWNEGAYHKKIEVTTLPPSEFDGKVYISTEDLSPKNATINITHDENVFCYCLAILDHATYMDMVDNYLGGDESLLQWYTTSYYGMMSGFSTVYTQEINEYYGGQLQAYLSDFVWEMAPTATYHVIATAMGAKDTDDGMVPDQMSQSFNHYTFELPDYTLAAPQIEVTGLPEESAFRVGFNVKCTNWQDAPVAEIAYAMNYVREFDLELSYGSTYADLVSSNRGYAIFSDDEIAQVNSDGGCNVYFDVTENSTSRLAVMGWNEEGRPSTFDGENPSAVGEASSSRIPDAEPIPSSYYEDLKGEWTATATIKKEAYGDPDGDGVYGYYDRTQEVKTKVTIGDITCPESLTQDVYDLYDSFGVSQEMTDAYFADLKQGVQDFNAAVRGQNRILCTGWGFDFYQVDGSSSALELATPWDLFIHPDYNAAYIDPLMFEFGPKWFLQVAEDGSLFVPVNINRIAPMSQWYSTRGYHLVGANPESNIANYTPTEGDMDDVNKWPNLPVEVSEDKQTITIKSYTLDDVVYYPNIVYDYWGSMYLYDTHVVSEIVLTKGWSGEEATANLSSKIVECEGTKVAPANNGAEVNIVTPKARTPFAGVKKVAPKKLEGKAMNFEQINARVQKFNAAQAKVRK